MLQNNLRSIKCRRFQTYSKHYRKKATIRRKHVKIRTTEELLYIFKNEFMFFNYYIRFSWNVWLLNQLSTVESTLMMNCNHVHDWFSRIDYIRFHIFDKIQLSKILLFLKCLKIIGRTMLHTYVTIHMYVIRLHFQL